jgi:hypothetical protein
VEDMVEMNIAASGHVGIIAGDRGRVMGIRIDTEWPTLL